MEDYKEFFYDVEPECRQFGELVQFKVSYHTPPRTATHRTPHTPHAPHTRNAAHRPMRPIA